MRKLIEIIDSENIKSNLESWVDECIKFEQWYHSMGGVFKCEIEKQKAFLKIEFLTNAQKEFYKNQLKNY